MQSEFTPANGGAPAKRVWRPPARTALLVIFGVSTVGFSCAAIFGSQNPGLAGIIALLAAGFTVSVWRQALYIEPTGVKLVLPARLRPHRIEWSDIEKFEVRLGVGQSPVTLIRASDQRPIAVPTYPRLRKPVPPGAKKYRVKVQRQVDELNALLETHRGQRGL